MQPLRLFLGLVLTVLVAACGPQPDRASGRGGQDKPAPAHPVEIAEVRMDRTGSTHERTGSLRTRRIVRIYSQEEGRITRLPVFEGDRVEQGQLLLSLDDELLKAELAKARATVRQARQDLQRISDLAKRQMASQDELARTQTALDVAVAEQQLLEVRLTYTQIHAPFGGVISARFWEPGDVVPRHSHILTLSDLSSLLIELRVSELLLPHLKVGDPAEVRIDALGNQAFTGRILRIHPDVDKQTRLGVLEVVLEPVPDGARAGQFARVTLTSAAVERILIPFTALLRDRGGEYVYLIDPEGKARRQAVRSGIRIADRVEIREGLEPGQRVITKGFLGLQEGKAVNPVNQPAAAAKG